MSSSFQSLIESGDCGAVNPVVDLARQFTQSSTEQALQDLTAGSSVSDHHVTNGQAPIGPSVADLLTQNHPTANPFDMASLMEQMKQMDALFERAINEDVKDAGPLPLISNPAPGVEEDFWAEALLESGSLPGLGSFSPDATAGLSGGHNWADEYFRTLEEDPTASLEAAEDAKANADLLSYRKRPLDEPFDSLFSSTESPFASTESPFASSNFFKSLPHELNSSFPTMSSNAMSGMTAFNLNDSISDQEERLMNMLLSNSAGQLVDEEVNEESAAVAAMTDDQIDQLLNTKDDIMEGATETTEQTEASTSDFTLPEALLTEPSTTATAGQSNEKFFYENQFDDMEFWMKLAEDWESSNETDNLAARRTEAKVTIIEALEELLKPENVNHYAFVAENPFLEQPQQPQDGEEEVMEMLATDYIEKGLEKQELGDIPAAILYFEAAAKTEPESARAWALLGSAQAKNENDRKAIAATKRSLALEPVNLEALMCLAICYTNESMANEACHALQEWLKTHESYRGLIEKATKGADGSSTDSYLGPTPLSKRWGAGPATGNIFSNGLFNTVRQCYIEAALQSPNEPDPDVQCGLGVLFNLSGEYEKAADCFRTAVSVRQSDHTLWNRLGATLANGGNSAEAMSAYREALLRYPGYIRARYNLGISCVLLGATREALDHLLAVLNLQTAGSKSVSAAGDSTLAELISHPNQITSANVWNTLRSVLLSLGRNDLFEAVDQRDLERLNGEFEFKLAEGGGQES